MRWVGVGMQEGREGKRGKGMDWRPHFCKQIAAAVQCPAELNLPKYKSGIHSTL